MAKSSALLEDGPAIRGILQRLCLAGARLEVAARLTYADSLGLSAFTCELRLEGAVLASAVLKVFEPA